MTLAPCTPSELADAVRSASRVVPVGAGTKPRLTPATIEVARVSTLGLRGIVEYDPSEFTFTALAGTPIREIAAALAERNQRLPFDPLLSESGATLGGTVAAGLSGPGRFRFGGIRDFILGVRFVDGTGRLLRMGGKVVKNSAGFDLPKFLVGSAGRFGVMAELTFKVFPRPAATRTLRLRVTGPDETARVLVEIGRARWEADALDAVPAEPAVYVRLAGPPVAIDSLANEIATRFPSEAMPPDEATAFWRETGEFGWARPGGALMKVPLTLKCLSSLCSLAADFPGASLRISGGGHVAFLWMPRTSDAVIVGERLAELELSAMTLRGEAPLWLGYSRPSALVEAMKTALDPDGRFPGLSD